MILAILRRADGYVLAHRRREQTEYGVLFDARREPIRRYTRPTISHGHEFVARLEVGELDAALATVFCSYETARAFACAWRG